MKLVDYLDLNRVVLKAQDDVIASAQRSLDRGDVPAAKECLAAAERGVKEMDAHVAAYVALLRKR